MPALKPQFDIRYRVRLWPDTRCTGNNHIHFLNNITAIQFELNLAGLRVGYAVGQPELISELHKTREPFNVNMLSQAAAMACLDNWGEVAGRARRNREQMDLVTAELENLGLEVVPSQTNFLLVRTPRDAGQMTQDLLQKGVIVRPMHAFGLGDGALRISIGLPEENRRCIEALKEIMS